MLAGREELFTTLHAWLSASDSPGPRTATLCGLGGAGKSSMAVEYAYRRLAEVGVAWQFPAGDTTVLAAGSGGLEHPNTLITRDQLAQWTGTAGDAARARDQYAALLPIREQVSGPEHPATLITRANLAPWTGEARDALSARDQLAALLPICERVLGLEHPDTQATRANLAYWTGEAATSPGPSVD